VILPAAVSGAVGLLLGSLGFFFVGFGAGTMCTDFYETGHHCDALYRTLLTGLIGQWTIVGATVAVLVIGLVRPAKRLAMAIIAWGTVVLAVAWYAAYAIGVQRSW
jgi:hypothetical protein